MGASYSTPNKYVALFTTMPDDNGENYVEVSGGDYTRKQHNLWTPTSLRITNNNGIIQFNMATALWGTITGAGVFDESSNGNLLGWGKFQTPKIIDIDDVLSLDSGSIVITISRTVLV